MKWSLVFSKDAVNDFAKLDGSQKELVSKAIYKVLNNPLPATEGGYGKPLRNKNGSELAGCCKIKLKSAGLRVVYKLIRTETEMRVIVIAARADDEVYKIASARLKK